MKFIKDVIFNVLAQAMFIAVQQLILFPVFEKNLGQKEFGWFLLIYGVFNVITVTIATSFTNLYQKKFSTFLNSFKKVNEYYVFYKIMIIYIGIFCIIGIIGALVFKLGFIIYLLLMLLIIFTTSRMFLIVWYRVHKNFTKILLINSVLSLLYAFLYIVNITTITQILLFFVVIEILINGLVYLICKIRIKDLIKSKNLNFAHADLNFLMISGFAGSLLNYVDRFIITALLGASSVTIFYVATLPTKLMLFPFNMLSSVVLSYLASSEKLKRSLKIKILISLPFILLIVFISTYYIGIVLIQFLYKQYLNDITHIYSIVTITFGLICLDSILRSFLLKFYSIGRKTILDVITLIVFVLLSIIFVFYFKSIVSIAVAQLLTYTLKVLVEVIILSRLEVE
ncbi:MULTISPECIES: hypothetical protein [Staphylococcus]|uniref:Uncharacterized protein n=2 Tax=Staphylococcus gallinarum TaxID=1293 RepID=A0A418HLF9_STAGA|nr:hypothetical protein [Staphylococcus gallinarum]MCD8827192.1 hypothetical protein [Staphylococcus gallinarum]RIL41381.1 hypothetical protein BUZ01_12510 [Staphylococcus gallinarum]RIO91950.1 hypothetical protein BUZ04_08085 [Staphylococcus gallinarum]